VRANFRSEPANLNPIDEMSYVVTKALLETSQTDHVRSVNRLRFSFQ